MRKNQKFIILYLLMLVAQMLICNYFHITQYVSLSILPVMVFCIPVKVKPIPTMIIAFLTGLAVDFLADGVIGLNALALVPIAILRNPIIKLVYGNGAFERGEEFSLKRSGFAKSSISILMIQTVFLLIYIWADGAGTREMSFNFIRLGASLVAGYLLSLFVIDILALDDRK